MSIFYENQRKEWTREQLLDIAGLIYDTDPYIYPAMFDCKTNAETIISGMFLAGDSMFCFDNLFTATEDDRVIGIILWKRGPLNWNPNKFIQCGGNPEGVESVKKEYFDTYKQTEPETVSMINICVSETARGKGAGRKMMEAFFKEVPGPYELVVLKDNSVAVHLYEKMGFVITDTYWGFGRPDMKVECFQMVRP